MSQKIALQELSIVLAAPGQRSDHPHECGDNVEPPMVGSFRSRTTPTIDAEPVLISDFFRQRLERLQRFDLESLEVSKTLLIDAICEEGLEEFERLKVWKGAYLEGEKTCGNADYLIAQRRGYLEAPYVCD